MMKKLKEIFSSKFYKVFGFIFLILIVLFFILIVFRTFHYMDVQRTNGQVSIIHSTKISVDDVFRENLPNDPGVEGDKTIKGIDANNNGIRDDVEIAIFKEYPDSARTRAVLLQYALALQMGVLREDDNTVVSTEIMREESRANTCIGDILVPRKDPESSRSYDEVEKIYSFISSIEEKQFNTLERKENRDAFIKNIRSYSDLEEGCDLDLSTLPN